MHLGVVVAFNPLAAHTLEGVLALSSLDLLHLCLDLINSHKKNFYAFVCPLFGRIFEHLFFVHRKASFRGDPSESLA